MGRGRNITAARFRAIKRDIKAQSERNYYTPIAIARQHGTGVQTVEKIRQTKNWAAYEAQKSAAKARQTELVNEYVVKNEYPGKTTDPKDDSLQMAFDQFELRTAARLDSPVTHRGLASAVRVLNERMDSQLALIDTKANKRNWPWSKK